MWQVSKIIARMNDTIIIGYCIEAYVNSDLWTQALSRRSVAACGPLLASFEAHCRVSFKIFVKGGVRNNMLSQGVGEYFKCFVWDFSLARDIIAFIN